LAQVEDPLAAEANTKMFISSALAVAVVFALHAAIASTLNVTDEVNTTTTSTTTITTYTATSTFRTTSTTSQVVTSTGNCIGNDSRCSGSSQQKCTSLSRQGADCVWDAPGASSTTTSQVVTSTGNCIGNDSRCSGSSQQECTSVSRQGADCEWVLDAPDTSAGDCSGNDNRCHGSNQAACARLAAKGSDCWWRHASGPEGICLGNDSRCAGSGKQMCGKLTSEGADCKWRAAFNLAGNLVLSVSNVDSFVSSPDVQLAAVSTVANITGLPEGLISASVDDDVTRRLSSTSDGKVMLTYACSVSGDAQPTPTGEEVSAALTSTNLEAFTFLISNHLDELVGEGVFAVSVLSTSDVILNISGGTSTRPQSSATTSINFQSSGTTTTTFQSSGTTSTTFQNPGTTSTTVQTADDDEIMDSDAPVVAAWSLAHGLVFVWSFFCLL